MLRAIALKTLTLALSLSKGEATFQCPAPLGQAARTWLIAGHRCHICWMCRVCPSGAASYFGLVMCGRRGETRVDVKPSITNTDVAWEWFGKNQPYFGVLIEAKYKNEQLNEEVKKDFFSTARPT